MSRGSIHAVSMLVLLDGLDAAFVRRARGDDLPQPRRERNAWQFMRRPG